MHLKFTTHFQIKIFERTLNVDHVKKAIREPDFRDCTTDGRIVVIKKIDDRVIKVIYAEHRKNQYFIISAYYLNI